MPRAGSRRAHARGRRTAGSDARAPRAPVLRYSITASAGEAVSLLEIQTDRLLLRPLRTLDAPRLLHLWTDEQVRRYLWADRLIAFDELQVHINRSLASFEIYGFGQFLILGRDDQELRGSCGLRLFGEPAEVELLIALYPQYWGQGIGSEAAHAVIRYGFETCHLPVILARRDAPAPAAARLMARLGLTPAPPRTLADGQVIAVCALAAAQSGWPGGEYRVRRDDPVTPATHPPATAGSPS
jgi:ribosomal-protein-alanine N-acetyltransferase